MDGSWSCSGLWHMDHEPWGVRVMDLILVRQLGVLCVHGHVEVCVLLLLRIDHDILAVLADQVQIPPPTLVRVLGHVLVCRP